MYKNWGKAYCISWWGDESNKNSLPEQQIAQCAAPCPPIVNYPFSSNAELQTAADLWITDNTSAICTYGAINTWDVSAITDMRDLFKNRSNFNNNISSWDVSNVTDMQSMFYGASSFNQGLNSWDVSSVIIMNYMFYNASSFNKGLNNWNVSNVQNMGSMFNGASSFNGNISSWDVSNVNAFTFMFTNATIFNKNLSSWNVVSVGDATNVFVGTALSTTNYDAILNGWSALTVKTNVQFGAGTVKYSAAGQTARGVLTSAPNLWVITDGGIV